MTTDRTSDKNHSPFSSAFSTALLAAMTEASGSSWLAAKASVAEVPPDESDPVRVKLALDGSLQGDFLLEFTRAEAVVLASALLKQPADEFGEEHAQALLKLVATSAVEFRKAVEQLYGTFTIEATTATQPPSSRASLVRFAAVNEKAGQFSVSMYLETALTEALLLHSRRASTAGIAGNSETVNAGTAVPEPVNLDLVMNVELNVTLRFGQRQLSLREVLELTTGSVVELDRQVEEPVELLLNGMVIARGEAVVIDGNYGLRVTEVTQPVSSLVLR
jgi:flagellar motor switch protein FliN/FliY